MKSDKELHDQRQAGTGFKFGKSAEYWWNQALVQGDLLHEIRSRLANGIHEGYHGFAGDTPAPDTCRTCAAIAAIDAGAIRPVRVFLDERDLLRIFLCREYSFSMGRITIGSEDLRSRIERTMSDLFGWKYFKKGEALYGRRAWKVAAIKAGIYPDEQVLDAEEVEY